MAPAETGKRELRLELGEVGRQQTDPRDPGALEDVDHPGRVVEREVVERRNDTVVDHLARADVHLTVGVTPSVTHVGLELGVVRPRTAALVERRERRDQGVLRIRVRGERTGQCLDHSDLHDRSGRTGRRRGRRGPVEGDRDGGDEHDQHHDPQMPRRATHSARPPHSYSTVRVHGSPHGDDRIARTQLDRAALYVGATQVGSRSLAQGLELSYRFRNEPPSTRICAPLT